MSLYTRFDMYVLFSKRNCVSGFSSSSSSSFCSGDVSAPLTAHSGPIRTTFIQLTCLWIESHTTKAINKSTNCSDLQKLQKLFTFICRKFTDQYADEFPGLSTLAPASVSISRVLMTGSSIAHSHEGGV